MPEPARKARELLFADSGHLPVIALTHEAKYAIRAGELARLLGIPVPDGGTVTVEHVNSSGRTTAIPPDHLLSIRVSWTDPGDAIQ